MLRTTNYELRTNEGFTLIEMVVAVGVFTVVMLISAGSLISIMGANRAAQAQKSVMNNINFAMDGMVRDIRVGTTYHCGTGAVDAPKDCKTDGADLFAFEKTGGDVDTSSDQIVYTLDSDTNAIVRSMDGGATFSPITAPEVEVTKLEFFVDGSGVGGADNKQPRVLILLAGRVATADESATDFSMQSLVSQRKFDR